MTDEFQPSLTYPESGGEATTGHSGTDTSAEQARSPKRARAQQIVLSYLTRRETRGATVAELRGWYPSMHHGSISSALTNLHRDGRLARLEEKRDRCHIYVVPEFVNGRATQPAVRVAGGRNKAGAQGQPAQTEAQRADLERRVENADTALAAMATEAYEDGYRVGNDLGWQQGYEAGVDAAQKRPGALLDARHDGVTEGRKQQAARTMVHVNRMRDAMKGRGPVEAHSTTCWMRHPKCALDAVAKAQVIP